MEVKTYQVGQIGTNCYFVGDEASKKGCMIDPGDEAENLIRLWGAFGYELSAILVTHGHFDHTTALAAVAAAFPATPVYIRREDVCEGGRPEFWQCAHVSGMRYVKDGDTIAVGNLIFTVPHPRRRCIQNRRRAVHRRHPVCRQLRPRGFSRQRLGPDVRLPAPSGCTGRRLYRLSRP